MYHDMIRSTRYNNYYIRREEEDSSTTSYFYLYYYYYDDSTTQVREEGVVQDSDRCGASAAWP